MENQLDGQEDNGSFVYILIIYIHINYLTQMDRSYVTDSMAEWCVVHWRVGS